MSRLLRPLVLALAVLAFASNAEASFDLSGAWLAVPETTWVHRLDFVQSSGTVVHRTLPTLSGWLPWAGSIDEQTGNFHLEFQPWNLGCEDAWTMDGTVADDGRTFTATLHYGELVQDGCASVDICVMKTEQILGTRCGNGALEPWEQCDFGGAADGDCCSSTCALEPAGGACPSDANDCTSDTCSSDGRCEHLPVAGACSEPHGCGRGECDAGECVLTEFSPAETSCERDASVCTPDTCDGAGNCQAGEWKNCPCGICTSEHGCVRPPPGTCTWPYRPCRTDLVDSADLRLQVGRQPARNRFHLDLRTEYEPDFVPGDPVSDGTSYLVCVYADDGEVSRPVFHARIPGGGTCAGKDCWQSTWPRNRFLYQDDAGTADGVNRMISWHEKNFQLTGRGGNLPVPPSVPPSQAWSAVLYEWGEYFVEANCWEQPLTTVRETSGFFRGEFRAP